jgi:hypothetical protein
MAKKKGRKKATKGAVRNTAAPSIAWHWSPRRQHDGKSFGNPALYATPQTVESLVRETGQNSLDASVGKTVMVRYRLIDLPAGSLRRQRFEQQLLLTTGLRSHLEAVAKAKKTQSAARIGKALKELDRSNSTLRLLVVEDYGTRGLIGDEFDSEGNFSALVRDVENSHKAEATAGGSFGLGSKTLWSCSGLLSVLFASKLVGEERRGTRTIGKADLGFHALANGHAHGYVGPGFFGEKFEDGGAVSTWLADDSEMLTNLCLARSAPDSKSETGTSALIVAFDDPESDEDDSQEIIEKLRAAAARNFWPAIERGSLRVFVRHEVGDKDELASDMEVLPGEYVPSFVDAYRRHLANDTDDKLRHPGDVVSVPVQQTVPGTRSEAGMSVEHADIAAEARLVIRLSEDTAEDRGLVDSIAMARGRAMVTQYLPKRGVALNARAFHAFLIAGTLAGDDDNQRAAEVFLRHAEPPSHDEWKLWSGLKARYSHGAGRRLDEFLKEVGSVLAKYVAVKPEASDDGPDALKRLLAIPSVTTAKSASWKVSAGTARIEEDVVSFEATFDVDRPEGLNFVPKIDLAAESGNVRLELIELEIDGAPAEVTGLRLAKSNKRLKVAGKATSSLLGLNLARCAIRLSASLTKSEKLNANS